GPDFNHGPPLNARLIMADPKDDDQKEGISMADIVKALVLAWSAALLTASYLGIFPQMKMDNTFVASLLTGAMASFGIERKTNGNGNKKPTIVDNKDTKAGIK
ncbi:MAG: hypothetical protein EBV86_02420, partial [Marivivens sp.]|nr:hypothetical protein [Marivivens sp.]